MCIVCDYTNMEKTVVSHIHTWSFCIGYGGRSCGKRKREEKGEKMMGAGEINSLVHTLSKLSIVTVSKISSHITYEATIYLAESTIFSLNK